jgi:hypothetical protein
MTLPNFYILGAQKSGTSWLTSMLRQHPDIFIPRQKEMHYYNRPENFARGRAWYENRFADCGGATAVGEGTPHYLAVNLTDDSAKIVSRIKTLTPDARFIISLRNPVTRAVSGLLHHMREGRLSPWKNLDTEFELLFSDRHPYPSVLRFGQYGEQIRSFLRHFPIHRFMFLIYEHDILKHPQVTLQHICQFLGVRTDFEFHHLGTRVNPTIRTRLGLVTSQIPIYKLHKKGRSIGRFLGWKIENLGLGSPLSVSDETLLRLYQYYLPDRKELCQIINRDVDNIWGTYQQLLSSKDEMHS